jgi:transposase InsO family protein
VLAELADLSANAAAAELDRRGIRDCARRQVDGALGHQHPSQAEGLIARSARSHGSILQAHRARSAAAPRRRGWYYLSTVLDDFSRYLVTWRLGPTMCASDVTATLDQALAASGLDHQ